MPHDIDAATARNWVAAYNGAQAKSFQKNEGILFDAKKILSIISQDQCVSVRIYFVQNPQNAAAPSTVVLVGVDSGGNDITKHDNLAEYGIHAIVQNPLQ